jgi:hypothetical protein
MSLIKPKVVEGEPVAPSASPASGLAADQR